MSYEVKILADSISVNGVRLVTIQATFPRFILAEVNTHRMFSRNSASSRAIPTEKLIERVHENPFVPETFNKRVKGMGVGEALKDADMIYSKLTWESAAEEAAIRAERLMQLGVDKSRANRILEPFMWHTAIISATEWDNFFGLRDHPAAQPEFQIIAHMMKELISASKPTRLQYGQWHLPLIGVDEMAVALAHGDHAWEDLKLVSAGRCARVSFDTHENWEELDVSIRRAKMLMGNGHFSPFEHPARPLVNCEDPLDVTEQIGDPHNTFVGNFRGWVQMRKEIPNEDRFDLALASG